MNDLISLIASPEMQQRLLFLKIVFLAISSVLIACIIYFIRHSRWWEFFFPKRHLEAFGSKDFKDFEKRKTVKTWEKSKKRLETKIPSEYKLAVIEADSFFNRILEKMGYAGESLGERLKKVPDGVLLNIDDIWEAHKIRNNIVHDLNYRLTQRTAEEVLRIYEEALKNLEIL